MRLKFLLIITVLLLISVGIVAAGSSTSFVVHRFVTGSGGLSESANYKVTSVIGQPNTDVANSTNYKVSAGFLHPLKPSSTEYLPMFVK